MKAPDLTYIKPTSVDEAVDALVRHGDDAVILAGGQSLVPMLNLRVAHAPVLVDINAIPGLSDIRDDGEHVRIGALTRYAALEASALVRAELPLLSAALPHVAHEAVRNRGTLGGSLALADPAAEMPACCLALGAEIVLAGPNGGRSVAIEDWFRGLYTTDIAPDEMIVAVRIAKPGDGALAGFMELARRRGDFAIAGVAASASDSQGVRIALLGAADRPVLARQLMRELEACPTRALNASTIADALEADTDPLDDPQVPALYRMHVLGVLARRVLDSLQAE